MTDTEDDCDHWFGGYQSPDSYNRQPLLTTIQRSTLRRRRTKRSANRSARQTTALSLRKTSTSCEERHLQYHLRHRRSWTLPVATRWCTATQRRRSSTTNSTAFNDRRWRHQMTLMTSPISPWSTTTSTNVKVKVKDERAQALPTTNVLLLITIFIVSILWWRHKRNFHINLHLIDGLGMEFTAC